MNSDKLLMNPDKLLMNSDKDFSIETKRNILSDLCQTFHMKSLIYVCKDENPCNRSINQYTECLKLVDELIYNLKYDEIYKK